MKTCYRITRDIRKFKAKESVFEVWEQALFSFQMTRHTALRLLRHWLKTLAKRRARWSALQSRLDCVFERTSRGQVPLLDDSLDRAWGACTRKVSTGIFIMRSALLSASPKFFTLLCFLWRIFKSWRSWTVLERNFKWTQRRWLLMAAHASANIASKISGKMK